MITPARAKERMFTAMRVVAGTTVCPGVCMSAAVVLLSLLVFSTSTLAAEVVVRLEAEPQEPWIGQKVVLKLDVLAADGWAQLQKTGGVELKGGYLLRLESQGTRLNETIKGVSYSGQRYEFLFFPQRGGALTIPEMAVDVSIKSWGADGKSDAKRLKTPSLNLSVQTPPGSERLGEIVSTTDFSATQKWSPEKVDLVVGDALVQTISLTAPDLTGMAFPPLVPSDTEGIRTYLSEPTVEDSYDRGSLVGKRHEKLTYMFEKPGNYELPGLSYNWWNTATETLETTDLPGLSVEVQPAPGGEQSGASVEEEQSSFPRSLDWAIALALICIGCVYRYRTSILEYIESLQRAYQESERQYFNRIRAAVRQGDTEAVMRTTMQWLDCISTQQRPARLDRFLRAYSDAEGLKIHAAFAFDHYGKTDKEHSRKFFDVLAAARSRWHKDKRIRKKTEKLLPQVGLSVPPPTTQWLKPGMQEMSDDMIT